MPKPPILVQIADFISHLRLKFQLLVAPAPFLLGVVASGGSFDWNVALQFLNVQVLLLGGATAFNSYYDKDEGPVEGLERPPAMSPWMLPASCGLQVVGLLLAWRAGAAAAAVYLVSILGFSFGYSHPAVRWKGRPLFSLLVIGCFGAVTPFLLGFLAAGGSRLDRWAVLAMAGVALVVVAMFPVAQAHQIEEDRQRQDRTFSAVYGLPGIRRLYLVAYPLGVALISASFLRSAAWLAAVFATLGGLAGIFNWSRIRALRGTPDEYRLLMTLKLTSGLAMNLLLAALLGAPQFVR